MLRPGDVILIDEDKSIAALVLEKHQGRNAWLDWRDGLTIGRKIGNQIALKDGLVSSRHCQIVRRKGSWYVEDLNSTNGTFLNDKRVTRAPFRPGDVLKLGRYRLRAGEKRPCLENLDGGVTLGVPEVQLGPEDVFGKKDYPWFSPAPRILIPQEDLHITIESAPSIGDKPSMSLGGLALSPAMTVNVSMLKVILGWRR